MILIGCYVKFISFNETNFSFFSNQRNTPFYSCTI